MNANDKQLQAAQYAYDLGVWENEGGSLNRARATHEYGRRVEPNRSWTVYHVFSGVPADIGPRPMVGLTEKYATSVMLLLNARNAERRRISLLQ